MAKLELGENISIDRPSGEVVRGSIGVLIAEGGQGFVYEADAEDHYRDVVVKWYKDAYVQRFHNEQLQAIRDLVEVGPPSDRYLWPQALVFADGNTSFGYVMDRRPASFEALESLVNTRIGDVSYESLITFGIQVAHSLQMLHTRGLAYRDINLSNFFIRPESGEALICDTDNIGFERRSHVGVLGKDGFMAPEIVRGEASPSANTDRHSLAVLLFLLFVRSHPLEGQATVGLFDDEFNEQHFGISPIFCFDPDDSSNRPAAEVAHAELYWKWYPQRLRDLFDRAFTTGLHDPQHGRVMESEWLENLVVLRDSTISCPSCGGLNFLDPASTRECRRPGCGAQIGEPMLLAVKLGSRTRRLVVLEGRRLFSYHIKSGYSNLAEVGRIVVHPDDPNSFGLVNTSTDDWQVRFTDGVTETVRPSDGVGLASGTVISAGRARISV